MAGQILKGILFLLFFQFMFEVTVCGDALWQRTAGNDCAFCKLLRTMVNKQNDLEAKIDLLLGRANCSAVAGSACPEGWVLREKSCFLIENIPTLKWSDARTTCQNLGGDLAIIRSADENNFIYDLVKKQKTVTAWGVWLGFVRKADRKFYWIDGTPLAGQYSPWGRGEPNNAGSDEEECGNMFGNDRGREGKWNDLWCDLNESQLKLAPSILCQKKSK